MQSDLVTKLCNFNYAMNAINTIFKSSLVKPKITLETCKLSASRKMEYGLSVKKIECDYNRLVSLVHDRKKGKG